MVLEGNHTCEGGFKGENKFSAEIKEWIPKSFLARNGVTPPPLLAPMGLIKYLINLPVLWDGSST